MGPSKIFSSPTLPMDNRNSNKILNIVAQGSVPSQNANPGLPWRRSGGEVVKNLTANAGDTGLSPGPGRSHMLRSN